MKKHIIYFSLMVLGYFFFSCSKEEVKSEKTNLLTDHIWVADSLLLDGIESGGAGGLLEDFTGDTKFNEDGTGYVGQIVGTWEFFSNETQIVITSDSLFVPVTTNIVELTPESLKLTTQFFVGTVLNVRMTFKPK